MPYSPTKWIAYQTPTDAPEMNNLETQYTEATNSFEQDLFSPFVLAGLVASKDAATPTQLDVTAGVAFLLQGDNTLRRRAPAATTFVTTVVSTTYYLDLQPDGSWSWGTAHSAQSGYLPVAQVTTDASGNISTVTDARTTAAQQFPGMQGNLTPAPQSEVLISAPGMGAYTGTIYGAVTAGGPSPLAGTQNGKSMSFPGTGNSYIGIPTTGLPTSNGHMSLECWLKVTAFPASSAVAVFIGTNSAGEAWQLQVDSVGHVALGLYGDTQTNGTQTIALNTWHHVVGTWDGTTMRCYVDGVANGTASGFIPNITYGGAFIGLQMSGTAPFNGSVAEVALYGTVLSATQVSNHYAVGRSGSATTTYAATVLADAPTRYYRLNDSTTNGRTAAIQCFSEHSPVIASDGGISPTYVAGIGGQAATGNFGVPVIVAQVYAYYVNSTGPASPLVFTVPTQGLYRVTASFYVGNGTPEPIFFRVAYTAQTTGSVAYAPLSAIPNQNVGTNYTPLLGGNGPTFASGEYACLPVTFYAKAGTLINVQYQDGAGTPNDYVNVVIERLM